MPDSDFLCVRLQRSRTLYCMNKFVEHFMICVFNLSNTVVPVLSLCIRKVDNNNASRRKIAFPQFKLTPCSYRMGDLVLVI